LSSTNPASESSAARSPGLLTKNHFLLRRLHSLSGIMPVGLFVIAHLFTNSQMLMDADGATYQHETDFIHSIPFLLFIEIGLWLSIGFHAVLGFWYTFTGKSNVKRYSYADNVRYLFQRITGIIALVFIFLHIATLRWRWDIFGWYTPYYGNLGPHHDVPMSMPLTAYALQFSWLVAVLYAIGTLSVIYHWANGLWTAAISWGITITKPAQQRWGVACAGLGVLLTVFFMAAMVAAIKYDFDVMTDEQRVEFYRLIEDAPEFLGEPAPAGLELEIDGHDAASTDADERKAG